MSTMFSRQTEHHRRMAGGSIDANADVDVRASSFDLPSYIDQTGSGRKRRYGNGLAPEPIRTLQHPAGSLRAKVEEYQRKMAGSGCCDPAKKLKHKIASYKRSCMNGGGIGLGGGGRGGHITKIGGRSRMYGGCGSSSFGKRKRRKCGNSLGPHKRKENPVNIAGSYRRSASMGGRGFQRIQEGAGMYRSFNGRAPNLSGGGVSREAFIKQHGAGGLSKLKAWVARNKKYAVRAATAGKRFIGKHGPKAYRGARDLAREHGPYIMENFVKPTLSGYLDDKPHGQYIKEKIAIPQAERYLKKTQKGGFLMSGIASLIAAASAAFASLSPAVAAGITSAATALGTWIASKALDGLDKALSGSGRMQRSSRFRLAVSDFTKDQIKMLQKVVASVKKKPSSKPMMIKILGPILVKALRKSTKGSISGRGLKLGGTGYKKRRI